jgi:ABC-type antimicrobial peptide transport system permease subunit
MPMLYAIKHVFRSWKLFLALLIGITLASAFFAGIDIKANATAKQTLDQELQSVYVDMQANINDLNSTQRQAVRDRVLTVTGIVDAEIISRAYTVNMKILGNNNSENYANIVALANNSQVYDGWLNRPPDEIGENETYVPENTPLASQLEINDVVQLNFSLYEYYDKQRSISLNLTVKGFAQLDDRASAIAAGNQYWVTPYPVPIEQSTVGMDFLFLVSWEKTMQKIVATIQSLYPSSQWSADTSLLIYLDRDALINPWDIATSINNIAVIENSVENRIANLGLSVSIQNNLSGPLNFFQIVSVGIRFSFTIVSLPIFFMAWYMGTTVSDVSFNLRRREIGLLSTKGFSKGQIQRTFLAETLLIGGIGGILGVFLAFFLTPLFSQFNANVLFNPNMISPYTMISTVIFAFIMAFLSTFSSSKKASQLPTVDALREYLPLEAEKPYRKRWVWIALILGTYKIAVFLSGINMTEALSRIMFSGGNFVLVLLIGIFMFVDAILNYIGPLLFFWGFTKLFIQISLEFQQLTTRAAKFLGDLGALATKNVRRNPARSAAIAFLIALIVGYSVQVNGQLASEQDYAVRQIYYQVGADVAVNVAYPNESQQVLNAIMANVSGYVQNITIEYTFSTWLTAGSSYLTLKAIEPNSWLRTAYYESEWFSGNDITTAFGNLASSNSTIVLERGVAGRYNLQIGENISVNFGSTVKNLEIVGFFGSSSSESQSPIMQQYISYSYWSYIPQELYKEISLYVSASAKILLKLGGGADGKLVAESIRNIGNPNIYSVDSFAEEWEKAQTNVIQMGQLDVQRLGIAFAVLAASVGTALISVVSLKERSREATIMSVKGLSYKQLVIMFLTENLALVVFSVILGIFVGFVTVYGNISSNNATILGLVKRRLVFPLDSALMLTSCLALIFGATILPILIMSRRYVTKLERMVRLR